MAGTRRSSLAGTSGHDNSRSMRIAILGAGNVGGNLGQRFSALGHRVAFGVRDPGKLTELLDRCQGQAEALSFADAVEHAEVVLLALPWAHTLEIVTQLPKLAGKVLIDCTNPVRWQQGTPRPMPLEGGLSAAELIQAQLPQSHVVKAFNTFGANILLNAQFGDRVADAFICSDHRAAFDTTADLARAMGFDVVHAGGLANARLLEHMAILWIYFATHHPAHRDIAIKLMTR